MPEIKSPIKLYNLVLQHLDIIQDNQRKVDIYNYSVDDFRPVLFQELLTNTRLILENQKINNLSSMGVDVCARVIIEICTLLWADKTNRFTDEQKKLFLLDYFGVEYNKMAQKDAPEELKEYLARPYNKIIEEYMNILGCSKEEAIKIAEERRAFLKYGGKRKYPTFLSFVLSILKVDYVECREMINFFIHPSYTVFQKKAHNGTSLSSERERIINKVLALASKNIPEIENKEYVKSKWNNNYIDDDTQTIINNLKKYFKQAYKNPFETRDYSEYWNESILDNPETRNIIFSCIDRIKCTLIDILMCESFGLKTQVIARMKSIFEMISMVGKLLKSNNIDVDVDNFTTHSKIFITLKNQQIYSIIKKYDSGESLDEREQKTINHYFEIIGEWYDEFKKTRDYPSSVEEFDKNIRLYPLYYLNPDPTYKYSKLFNEVLMNYIDNKKIQNEIINDYKWSAMLGHVSAYNSELRMNKAYRYIPNLLTYLISVLSIIDVSPSTEELIDYLKFLVNEIRDNNRTKYEEDLSSKYKKLD